MAKQQTIFKVGDVVWDDLFKERGIVTKVEIEEHHGYESYQIKYFSNGIEVGILVTSQKSEYSDLQLCRGENRSILCKKCIDRDICIIMRRGKKRDTEKYYECEARFLSLTIQ